MEIHRVVRLRSTHPLRFNKSRAGEDSSPRFVFLDRMNFEGRMHMNQLRVLTTRALAAFLFFVLFTAFSQTPAEPDYTPGRPLPVKTVLLITSYPVADLVTSNFFDSFRKGIRELNLPIDCHVVELNATVKNRGEMLDSTFERLVTQINDAMYSAVVTVNYEAAKMIMEHYDELSRDIPVIFVGLGRVPPDLKHRYPNSTAISIADDTTGTIDLSLKLFPIYLALLLFALLLMTEGLNRLKDRERT